MFLLKFLLKIFLFPGDLVRRLAGITVEQDGGILRSFVNMCFWGVVFTVIAMKIFL